ncbi:hypothetical protein [Fangia hongkongensis]|uniref:hypothetical protein n=1 Tax=Fangia hongkongensis TaxID=270495 RepID=UPI0003A4BDA7|nr:hypothetical protein [Fangia hongkongensis]MBK2125544.1 hypothetical protein [Fangia hongkongensis]
MGNFTRKPIITLCSALFMYGALQAGGIDAGGDSSAFQKVIAKSEASVKEAANKTAEKSVTKSNGSIDSQQQKLSVSMLGDSADSTAAASNNTEAAKKFAFGEISVALPSGAITASVKTPSFSAMMDLTLSFSSGLYQSQKATNEGSSAFGLPYGLFIKGLPYIHSVVNNNKNYLLLFWGGADYYISTDYQSEVSCDSEGDNCTSNYQSGLKYQTSKLYHFATTLGMITIHREDGTTANFNYSYVLSYANGATYYFNDQGLCTIMTDRYFQNDTEDNSKHIIQIDYVYSDRGAMDNLLSKITDADGTVLNFKNVGNYLSEIDYPKNASAEGEVFKFDVINGSLLGISSRLDDSYDIGFYFVYDTNGLIKNIEQVLYDKGGFNISRHYVDNEFSYYKATDDNNAYKITAVDKTIYGGDGSVVGHDQESYGYTVMSKPSYQFGSDVALDNASSYDYNHATTIVSQCIGINCDLKITHNYNQMGLELLTQTAENVDGTKYRKISDTYYQYSGIDDSDPYDNAKLAANYNQPIRTISIGYNNDELPVSIAKQEVSYNDYGSPLVQLAYPATLYTQTTESTQGVEQKHFIKRSKNVKAQNLGASQVIMMPSYPNGIDPVSKVTYGYDSRYQETILTDSLDCGVGVNHTDCTKARETIQTNILTEDGRHVEKEQTTLKNLATGESAVMPEVNYVYGSDTAPCLSGDNYFNAALVCKKTVSDSSGKSVTKSYGYTRNDKSGYFPEMVTSEYRSYIDPTGATTAAEVAGASQESQGVSVTKTTGGYETNVVSTFAAVTGMDKLGTQSLSKVTSYNVYGLPLTQKDKEGKVVTHSYDFKNMIMASYLSPTSSVNGDNTSPILQSRKQYDGLGNVIRQYAETSAGSNGADPTYIVTQTNYYDYKEGKALLAKQTDAFGNYSTYQYDAQLRPVLKQVYQVQDA